MWRARAIARGMVREKGALASEQLARIAYHVPFCKMARKAHFHVRKCDLEDRAAQVALALEPARGAESFDLQVAPSLHIPSRIGNTYTASLYFGIASLLHTDATSIEGRRIGMFSYGSGCSSEFFSGVVGERAGEVIARARLGEALAERTQIDVDEYERIMGLERSAPSSDPLARGSFRFVGVEDGRRTYAAAV
jgi:hydroxymethylglutaryl-CoA synthase